MKLNLESSQSDTKTDSKGRMSAPAPSSNGLGKIQTRTGLSATRLKQFQELKTQIHRKMVDRLDLSNI